jgi:hypothetical protein
MSENLVKEINVPISEIHTSEDRELVLKESKVINIRNVRNGSEKTIHLKKY